MSRRRLEQGYFCILGLLVLIAVAGFIWPNYSRASQVSAQIVALEGKIGRLDDARQSLKDQTKAVQELKAMQVAHCRRIPESAKVAELVRILSLEVDGVQVADQTFRVSGRRDNVDGEERFEGLSMIVDLEADFEHICSVIDRCASLDHLVRVTGLDVSVDRDGKHGQRLQASVSIDAIYQSDEQVTEGGTP